MLGCTLSTTRDVVAGADDRPLVVGQPGAIGGADVDQAGTRLLEHVGNPERPSDLHRLASRHGDVPPGGQRRQHQQHGGGVVVDHDRLLGAAQLGEQLADGPLARAAVAGGQVELDGLRQRRLVDPHRSAPEVGVEQHAGGVDDRVEQRAPELLGAGAAEWGSPSAIAARAMSTRIGCGSPVPASDRASTSTDGGRAAAGLTR